MIADNDIRGWVMSAVSGAACVIGSSVICVDLILRRFSPLKDFQIANSNGFLSGSLCLSAGVMLFTSLYSMLPTSKQYLTRAGFSPRAAAFILIGLFVAGVVVIRLVSAFIHHHIPSQVVDCHHTHEQDDAERGEGHAHEHAGQGGAQNGTTEHTPLLRNADIRTSKLTPEVRGDSLRKGPFRFRFGRSINLLMGEVKPLCDENGPCYGFSQACGYECTKTSTPKLASSAEDRPLLPHNQTIAVQLNSEGPGDDSTTETVRQASTARKTPTRIASEGHHRSAYVDIPPPQPEESSSSSQTNVNEDGYETPDDHDHTSKHHHHVPQNAFLSIGLQTVLAIALHKLPEGFITYATNHANPTLGMTVFLALFIHNISEGFAMALPLYLALYSRWKAIVWSSLLGGISQPAGAGLAALWIWGAQKAGGHQDTTTGSSWGVYGGMFAATAGVMTSVALQLFSEGLALTHNRALGIAFAIAGMGVMGLSFALTA